MFGIPFITALLGRRFGEKIAGALSSLITAALIAGLFWLAYCWAWDRGRDHQRDLNDKEIAEISKERDDAMAELGRRDAADADTIENELTEDRKELDDATAHIPDRPPSARQRLEQHRSELLERS